MLVVVSNFGHMAITFVPSMLNQLESALNVSLLEDRQTLNTVIKELDKTLFDGYVNPKAKAVQAILRNGILDPKMDWYETPQPEGALGFSSAMTVACESDPPILLAIRPYMYETLMYLVGVHAQVCEAAEPLLPRTLNFLVEGLAAEALANFRTIKRFGVGGMLRVSFPLSSTTLSRLSHYLG